MSEFVMIAPEGWLQLDTDWYISNTDLTPNMIENLATSTVVEFATSSMLAKGDLIEGEFAEDVKLIDGTIWVKVGR